MREIAKTIAQLLVKKNLTLAVAESCTGGLLCHRLTDIPGSSRYLKLGVIAYSNENKIAVLKVPRKILGNFGAVSKETALIMAKNVLKIGRTDLGISITGIAGPTGATTEKPVGLVYIAVADKTRAFCQKFIFKGKRPSIKQQSADQALKLLQKFI